MKKRYDRRAELRELSVGDRVLALCPLVSSPFQGKFMGPYTVVKWVSDQNYLLSTLLAGALIQMSTGSGSFYYSFRAVFL